MMKMNVGVIFGGRSVEHDVSIITAHQAIDALDKSKYNIVPIYITKEGQWLTGNKLLELSTFKNLSSIAKNAKRGFISPLSGMKSILKTEKNLIDFFRKNVIPIDVILPAIHGTFGEDGSLQGLLELADIPYVGAGVLGSAIGMDKISMKAAFKENGLPVAEYWWFHRFDWNKNQEKILDHIEKNLGYSIFVKPASLGSSVGISKAKNRKELKSAIDIASYYDSRLLVEKSLDNCIEINCSVLGNFDLTTSVCEQPISWGEFLSFSDKYLTGSKALGMKGTNRKIPAQITNELTEKVKEFAKRAFVSTECRGIARIDFLVDKGKGNVYVNEVNTIPGSFAFYLWEYNGISFTQLLDRLIELAFEIYNEKRKNIYSYDSSILDQTKSMKAQKIR
jgi:D-alanine-D-alanine ligase